MKIETIEKVICNNSYDETNEIINTCNNANAKKLLDKTRNKMQWVAQDPKLSLQKAGPERHRQTKWLKGNIWGYSSHYSRKHGCMGMSLVLCL